MQKSSYYIITIRKIMERKYERKTAIVTIHGCWREIDDDNTNTGGIIKMLPNYSER